MPRSYCGSWHYLLFTDPWTKYIYKTWNRLKSSLGRRTSPHILKNLIKLTSAHGTHFHNTEHRWPSPTVILKPFTGFAKNAKPGGGLIKLIKIAKNKLETNQQNFENIVFSQSYSRKMGLVWSGLTDTSAWIPDQQTGKILKCEINYSVVVSVLYLLQSIQISLRDCIILLRLITGHSRYC